MPDTEMATMLNGAVNNALIKKAMKDVTDVIGKYGPWQRVIFILFLLRGLPTAFHNLSTPFFAFDVDHWCKRPSLFQNWSIADWKNYSIPLENHDDKVEYSHCYMYKLERLNGSSSIEDIYVNKNKTVYCSSWEFDRSFYQSTIINDFDLVCKNGWLISLSQSVYMGGMTAGVIISGHLADRFGRQPILRYSVTLMLISGIATALSPTYIFFNIARFCLALGVAGAQNTAFCLLMEVLGPEYRTKVTFAFSFGWATGLMLLPGIAYLLRDWVYLQIFSTALGSILLLYWCFIPESPRWLLTRGRYKSAEDIIKVAADKNNMEIPNMQQAIVQLKENIEKEEQKKNPNVFDLFRTSNLRKHTIFIYFCYFSVAFVFYGLSLGQTNLGGNPFLNFFIGSSVEFPAYVICMFLIKYVYRRTSLLGFYVIGGVSCFFMIANTDELLWLKITAAMLGKLCISGAFMILATFAAEIFPTVVRTVGVGSSLMMGRIGAAVAPFVKELGEATHSYVPPIVYGILSLLAGGFIMLLPETFNRQLPDTIGDAENYKKNIEKENDDFYEIKQMTVDK
ncbi:organic cation transporter protein-like [Centruroides sculpturatus]|uniref:organic cation transporter protein-like n=1 Tax=Centruroides sculpturatus TaxID=218467 RepID=UPI000C6CE15B|nr:organic cation transporter protein-like [Centruroides sculpturatus]